jgi:nitrogen-specific signal transduction histidine kinase
VRHNDGAIDFESQPGRTEFRVRLPVAENYLAAVVR